MLQIRCKNTGVTKSVQEGTSLLDVYQEFADEIRLPYPVVSAKVNNVSQGLKFRLYQNRDVEFLDAREGSGHRVYVRSLCFVLYKATQDVFPGSKLFIEHSLCRGYYCNFKKRTPEPLTDEDVRRISQRMQEIIALDMPFRRTEATNEETVRVFTERGFADKVKLLETSGQIYSHYYTLGDTVDYYYGPLVPSAGYLTVWALERYEQGLLLRIPDWNDPSRLAEKVDQPKTFGMFAEKTRWDIIMRLSNAGDVNKAIQRGYASELIQVSEALQEKKIVQIAEDIFARCEKSNGRNPIVLITGPSSSGKTTFCKRLSIQLLACGLRPLSFSTDDYFVNRVDTPKLPNGDYDFDNIETVEYSLLEDHLLRLIKGERVEIPEYNFVTGQREWNGKRLKLASDTVLIIEGIHALNPLLTQKIDDAMKYKIYISALTSISLDDHNWIPVSHTRLQQGSLHRPADHRPVEERLRGRRPLDIPLPRDGRRHVQLGAEHRVRRAAHARRDHSDQRAQELSGICGGTSAAEVHPFLPARQRQGDSAYLHHARVRGRKQLQVLNLIIYINNVYEEDNNLFIGLS